MAKLSVLTNFSNHSSKKECDSTFEFSLLKMHRYLYLKTYQYHHWHHLYAHIHRVKAKSPVAVALSSECIINNSILFIPDLFYLFYATVFGTQFYIYNMVVYKVRCWHHFKRWEYCRKMRKSVSHIDSSAWLILKLKKN